jgi:methyltransferase (TIGR00027 family)
VSDTAFLVAAYRLAESKRSDSLFDDRLAEKLLGDKGEELLARFSMWKLGEWMMAVRTVIIDRCLSDLVANGLETVVNLAAGLDTRPYRMALPKQLNWIEADYEGITDYKTEILKAEEPRCNLTRVKVDLAHASERERFYSTFKDLGRFAVLTEGLLVYLEESDVRALSDQLNSEPNLQAWITDITTRDAFKAMQHLSTEDMVKSAKKVSFKFLPEEGIRYFEPLGWKVKELYDFLEYGKTLNRDLPVELSHIETALFKATGIGVLTR